MRRERLLAAQIHERFIVTLVDGVTINGLLAAVDARVIMLVDAGTMGPAGQLIPIDGALYVERSRVAYLQRP